MPSWKSGTFLRLHQPASSISIVVEWGPHANIAAAFLHDDAQYYALLDADGLGSVLDGIEESADILGTISRFEHGWFVDLEEGGEVFPRGAGRECGGWAGEEMEGHLASFGVISDS